MAYHFFSTKKNDVRICGTLMKRIRYREDADETDFFFCLSSITLSIQNFDKVCCVDN